VNCNHFTPLTDVNSWYFYSRRTVESIQIAPLYNSRIEGKYRKENLLFPQEDIQCVNINLTTEMPIIVTGQQRAFPAFFVIWVSFNFNMLCLMYAGSSSSPNVTWLELTEFASDCYAMRRQKSFIGHSKNSRCINIYSQSGMTCWTHRLYL
jgi:hypothetical protein